MLGWLFTSLILCFFLAGSLLFNPINAWLVIHFTDPVFFLVGSLLFNPINAWLVTLLTDPIFFLQDPCYLTLSMPGLLLTSLIL